MGQLNDKVALITGATAGIGLAMARTFTREGARVVLAARREDEGSKIEAALRAEGADALFVRADVTQERDVVALMDAIRSRHGRLDVAVNNAAVIGSLGPIVEQSAKLWHETLDSNLTSTFLCVKYELPLMQRGGSIINLSSVAGYNLGFAGAAMYCAAKAGVVGFTRALASEVAGAGIRANTLVPGAVDTPMFRSSMGATEESARGIAARHALGRVGEAQELANAALFLASDASSFVTGAELVADGGMSIR